MTIERIISPNVTEPPAGTWSNCLRVGDTVYVAGLVASNGSSQASSDTVYAQSRVIFQKMASLLAAAGGSLRDVVKLNSFVTDITKRDEFWRARREFFTGAFPVSTLVEVSALVEPALLIEIEAVAVLNHGGRPAL
jgi:enamine deaminase RidA (YjgF/YER057c/UK114 family)